MRRPSKKSRPADMVRGRKAECTVQRSILSPGTAKLRRVLRTKQPKHNESEALPAAETAELELGQLSNLRARCDARWKFG